MDKSKFNLPTILAIAAVVYVLFGAQLKEKLGSFDISKLIPSGGGASSTETFPDKPSDATILAAAEQVKSQLSSADAVDKLKLARLWRETAKLILADNSVVQTTADVRRANGLIGKVADLGIKNKYPGLAPALTAATKSVLGDDPTPVDRAKAAALFNGFSWAARQ
jgi:hypothetical protein